MAHARVFVRCHAGDMTEVVTSEQGQNANCVCTITATNIPVFLEMWRRGFWMRNEQACAVSSAMPTHVLPSADRHTVGPNVRK